MFDARPRERARRVGALGNLLDVPDAVDVFDDLRGRRPVSIRDNQVMTCVRRLLTLSIVRSQFGSRILARSIRGNGTCQSSTTGGLIEVNLSEITEPDSQEVKDD
jgi:hypothetical protein